MGWCTIFIIVVGVVMSLVFSYNQSKQHALEREKREQTKQIAYGEIKESIQHIKSVLSFASFLAYKNTYGDTRIQYPTSFAQLQDATLISLLEQTSLTPRRKLNGPFLVPYGTDSRYIDQIISEEIREAVDTLDVAISKYDNVSFDVKVLDLSSKITNHPFIKYLIKLPSKIDDIRRIEDSDFYPFPLINTYMSGSSRDSYLDLVQNMEQLMGILNENSDDVT